MKHFFYTAVFFLFTSCVGLKQKKSADYYLKNEKSISRVLELYSDLYNIQPCSLGFSDRSLKHVGMDIMTDTIRYALNNEESEKAFFKAILGFKYDTVKLRSLFVNMHKIKCIWLGRDRFIYKGNEHEVVFLSFGSVKFGNPFLDRKYYQLVIFKPDFINPETEELINKSGYKKVNTNVYYTIADSFR